MSKCLKIAIAEDEPDLRQDLQETLQELGHQVVIAARDGNELVEQYRDHEVDLVITDIRMPHCDGLSAMEKIRKIRSVPIVILSAFHDDDLLERAKKESVMAYLVKPIQVDSLQTSIELAVQRFKEFQALQAQTQNLQQALDDRKVLEKAKGVLMQRAKLSEPEAFRRLQLLSSQKNQKMISIAQSIIDADKAFQP